MRSRRPRAAACRVAGQWAGRFSASDARRLEPLVGDPHPRVRLEAVRALAAFPEAASAAVAARALKLPVDTGLDYALWLTLRELSPAWLGEVRAGRLDFGDPAALVFALKAAGSGDGLKPIVALLEAGKVAPERRADLLVSLAQLGGADDVAFAVRGAAGAPANRQAAVLDAAADSVAARKLKPPAAGIVEALRPVLADTAGAALPAACRLAGALKLDALRPELEAALRSDAGRRPALAALAQFPDARAILAAYAAGTDALLARLALAQLAPLDAPRAATLAAGLLPRLDAAADVAEVVAAFSARKGGAAELAKAVAPLKLSANAAKVGAQAARAGAQPDAALVEAFARAGNLAGVKWAFAPADAEQFLREVAAAGDPARGEAVFRRPELNCLKCHAVAGAGGLVGPDLSSIGASAQPDYVLESLTHPNAKVKEGYNTLTVVTQEDRVISGVRVRETAQELVLRDAEGAEVRVAVADIAERKGGLSLMPEGLVDPLPRADLRDLTRFLSELGKGGYAAAPRPRGPPLAGAQAHPGDVRVTQPPEPRGRRGARHRAGVQPRLQPGVGRPAARRGAAVQVERGRPEGRGRAHATRSDDAR